MTMLPRTKRDEIADAAMDRARKSDVILIRKSPRRYAIARLTGHSARGGFNDGTMIGVKGASILYGLGNLSFDEAMGHMYLFDTGQMQASDCKTV